MTLDTIAERVLDKEELDQLIADALARNLDAADICDETSNSALMLGDKAVALMAHDDSGTAQLLLSIAIKTIKQARQKAEAA